MSGADTPESPLPGALTGVSPEPAEEEAAAIAAVVTLAMSASGEPEPATPTAPRWRFSGRWWSTPITSRRSRP